MRRHVPSHPQSSRRKVGLVEAFSSLRSFSRAIPVLRSHCSRPAVYQKKMIAILLNLGRKWGVGVCLFLWCCIAYVVMGLPALLGMAVLSELGVSAKVTKWAVGAYVVLFVPLLTYQFGRAFGLRYDKIPVPPQQRRKTKADGGR